MNTDCPFSVTTLQETHISADSDVNLFNIPDYSLVYDPARINRFGCVAIYRVFSPVRERADNFSLMKKTLFLHSFYEITK